MIPFIPLAWAAGVVGLLLWLRQGSWRSEWGQPNKWDQRWSRTLYPPGARLPWTPADFHPEFWRRWLAAQAAARALGLDPVIDRGPRRQIDQAYFYGQGRPDFPVFGRQGNRITWTLKSNHSAFPARAADIKSASAGYADQHFYSAWGPIAEAHGLSWGGRWKVRDLAHIELPGAVH